MLREPRAGFLAWLDRLLTEEQRRLPAEVLSRFRILLGITVFLLGLNLLFLFSVALRTGAEAPGRLMATAGMTVCFLVVLGLVRKSSSPTLPSLLLCSAMAAGFLLSAYTGKEVRSAVHPSTMVIPAMAVYLLGPRLGFIFTAVFALNAVFFLPFYVSGFGERPLFEDGRVRVVIQTGAISMLLGWALSWLYSTAREKAHAEREEALRTLRESEGQMVSLLESTDDVVLSLDTRGRLVTANQAARSLFLQVNGRELVLGDTFFVTPLPARESHVQLRERFIQALGGQRVRLELPLPVEGQLLTVDVTLSPVLGEGGRVVRVTVFGRDITARKAAEARLSELHRSLLDVSRQAGMAEVATGVLHNVGNTLNSVNVSTELVAERLRNLRVSSLAKATELLCEHATDPGPFLTEDPKGRQLPAYLKALSEQFTQERDGLLSEIRTLGECVEHIKAIVSMQQEHARSGGVLEQVPVPQLIDDALRLHAVSFERLGIRVRTEYAEVPPVLVDRHKLLLILLNLLSNARHALLDSGRTDKQLTLRVVRAAEERLHIEVKDNGVGVAPEHLARLFTQGFTTKKGGHGFGLHSSALAALELKGSLTCTSAGPGEGATFTIELPRGDVLPVPQAVA
jgi:PAS domain S-box-containing protein